MKKTHIVIHHSATPDGQTFGWAAIRKYHTSYRISGVIVSKEEFEARQKKGENGHFETPWRDIGYHFGIELVGDRHEIVVGRYSDMRGAHCPNLSMNDLGLGVCLIGNFDAEVPSTGLWTTAVGFIADQARLLAIPPERIVGHREAQERDGVAAAARKTCPGRLFKLDEFRLAVGRSLAGK